MSTMRRSQSIKREFIDLINTVTESSTELESHTFQSNKASDFNLTQIVQFIEMADFMITAAASSSFELQDCYDEKLKKKIILYKIEKLSNMNI